MTAKPQRSAWPMVALFVTILAMSILLAAVTDLSAVPRGAIAFIAGIVAAAVVQGVLSTRSRSRR